MYFFRLNSKHLPFSYTNFLANSTVSLTVFPSLMPLLMKLSSLAVTLFHPVSTLKIHFVLHAGVWPVSKCLPQSSQWEALPLRPIFPKDVAFIIYSTGCSLFYILVNQVEVLDTLQVRGQWEEAENTPGPCHVALGNSHTKGTGWMLVEWRNNEWKSLLPGQQLNTAITSSISQKFLKTDNKDSHLFCSF